MESRVAPAAPDGGDRLMLAILALALALRCPDAFHLRYEAARAGLPPAAVLAVAEVESDCDVRPTLRGHYCWWRGHHPRNCEVGRFQIKPSTARARCPGFNVFHYEDNVECFLWMFKRDTLTGGLFFAVEHQNGGGRKARAYVDKVLARWMRDEITSGGGGA